jgi:hypothetical protein
LGTSADLTVQDAPRLGTIELELGGPGRHASGMDPLPPPLAFFLLLVSGWVNRHQQHVIDYLREENRILRAAHGSRWPSEVDGKLTKPVRQNCGDQHENAFISNEIARIAGWSLQRE